MPASVPTEGTAYGTPDGMPNSNYASGSPYFDLGGTLPSDAPFPNAEFGWGADGNPNTVTPGSNTMGGSTAQPFDWSFDFGNLGDMGGGGGGGYGGYSAFVAPTGVDEQNDPGYKFRLSEAKKALENSAASKGTLLTGDFTKSLTDYIGNSASQEYGNVFNRALSGYSATASAQNTANSIANQGRSIDNANNENIFRRGYDSVSLGLRAAEDAAGASGTYATNSTNLATGFGNAQANLLGTRGSVNAAGSAQQANIWSAFPGTLASFGRTAIDARY